MEHIKAIKHAKSGTVYFPLFAFSLVLYIVHLLLNLWLDIRP